ncbi:sensor histidine kinase [Actinomadura yumaensis]|uniref:sensor histidine kinase n=1 Tax=Actinomadura yumaensis TaxID=111807 RepID=UPI003619679B
MTAASAAIVGLLLLLGVVAFYQAISRTVYDGLRERGTIAVNGLVAVVRSSDPRGRLTVEDADFPLLQVVDGRGRVIAASDAMAGRPELEGAAPGTPGRPAHTTAAVPGVTDEAYIVTVRVRGRGGWRVAHAAAPLTEFSGNRPAFVTGLAIAVLLGTGGVALVVWRSVGRALRPVRRMSGELAEITGGRADRRVTVPGCRDEVAELAESVNVTLGRLQRFVERQRSFVADASHELRSPLTGLRAQLEVALQHPEDEDWPAVARTALGDAERLARIVGDLLVLAKLDAGVPAEREDVDLGGLARAEAARPERRVPVDLDVAEGAVVLGVRHHLARLLTNLLDNAERHAASRVRVTVAVEGDEAVAEVADDGSGIAPEDRERVFRRFQRLPEGRARDKGGSGLGLAISRDIAIAHGGSLVAADSDRGARLVLRLPLADASPPEPSPGDEGPRPS